ncbi:MAG: 2-hydroxychromene-2-carboxylate isomerase [Methylobacteriaceae bacterium]|nr:2-hydroxychromene-2-carboxylate isomerase [Methylobacteriaceae bacterium]
MQQAGRPRRVTYVMTLASPWVYLGHRAFLALAARYGLAIEYRPVPLGDVFSETGGLPLAKRHPARQRYRLVELQRWREKRGLPLNFEPRHPRQAITLADRCILALAEAGHDPGAFVTDASAGVWADERNMSDPAEVAASLRAAGADPQPILTAAEGEAITARYAANAAEAIGSSIFGAPTYILDGEPFWGQDRLELLEDALRSGRAPYRPD